jgi:hypothetical protein
MSRGRLKWMIAAVLGASIVAAVMATLPYGSRTQPYGRPCLKGVWSQNSAVWQVLSQERLTGEPQAVDLVCHAAFKIVVAAAVGERSTGVLGYSSPTYCWCCTGNILGCISECSIGLRITTLERSRMSLFSGGQQPSRRYGMVKNLYLFGRCWGIKLAGPLYPDR